MARCIYIYTKTEMVKTYCIMGENYFLIICEIAPSFKA